MTTSLLTPTDPLAGWEMIRRVAVVGLTGTVIFTSWPLVVLAETGELALVEASPLAFRELGRIQAIDGKTWNNPVLVGSRIFVRNHLEMAAYDLPLADAAAEKAPAETTETTSIPPAASQP